jgi:hypothetical protein
LDVIFGYRRLITILMRLVHIQIKKRKITWSQLKLINGIIILYYHRRTKEHYVWFENNFKVYYSEKLRHDGRIDCSVRAYITHNNIILSRCDDSSDGTSTRLLRENYGVKTLVRSTDHQSVLLSFDRRTIPIVATTSMKTTTEAVMNIVGKVKCGAVRPIPR